MLKENLAMLRKIHGYSQEEVAEKVGISRQAYAKWERGTTIPDVEKCALRASTSKIFPHMIPSFMMKYSRKMNSFA